MKYITIHCKRDSIQSKCNHYFNQGYKLHTCLKDIDADVFIYLLIFEKIEI